MTSFPQRVHLPIWAVALTSLALIIYSVYPTTTAGEDKQLLDSFLNSYTRAVWAAAVGWVVLACAQGYGGMRFVPTYIRILVK